MRGWANVIIPTYTQDLRGLNEKGHKALADRIVVACPPEADALPLAGLVPLQFMGTSNYERFGPTIPTTLPLVRVFG